MSAETESRVRGNLAGKYPAEKIAIWHIKGEDPNCDMGGSHIMPSLAFVEGQYQDAVAFAMECPNFICWGAGGSITEVKVISLSKESIKRYRELKQRAKTLEKELDDVRKELERSNR